MYEPVRSFLNPEWILLAENEREEGAAFLFCLDDIYNRSGKSLVAKTVARVPDDRYRGIGTYLTGLIHKKAYLAGYVFEGGHELYSGLLLFTIILGFLFAVLCFLRKDTEHGSVFVATTVNIIFFCIIF